MDPETDAIRIALLKAEAGLREAIGLAEPNRPGDQPAMKDLQEALGLVAGWRISLETGRWEGRSFSPTANRN